MPKNNILGDELFGIIWPVQWLYKNKFSRLICYCLAIGGVGYLCLYLQFIAASKWKNVIALDILFALICLEVALIVPTRIILSNKILFL